MHLHKLLLDCRIPLLSVEIYTLLCHIVDPQKFKKNSDHEHPEHN